MRGLILTTRGGSKIFFPVLKWSRVWRIPCWYWKNCICWRIIIYFLIHHYTRFQGNSESKPCLRQFGPVCLVDNRYQKSERTWLAFIIPLHAVTISEASVENCGKKGGGVTFGHFPLRNKGSKNVFDPQKIWIRLLPKIKNLRGFFFLDYQIKICLKLP